MQQTFTIKERIDDGKIETEQHKESVMRERQALQSTSGSSSMKPKSFSVTLRSSVEDVHVVTLPAHISTADQTNTHKLDAWSRFNEVTEFEDINQLEPRLVASRISIIDRQDRILKAQLEKINHDRKSMNADMRKYEDLEKYIGKCEYGDDIKVVNTSDILADVEFLLDEKAAQKLDLEELLERLNSLKSQVEYRMKKLVQGIAELKSECDKQGLQGEDDEAEACLRNLLMKIGPFGKRSGGTKIPILLSASKSQSSKDRCREFISSKTTSRKIGNDGIHQMQITTEPASGRHVVRPNTDEKKKYTSKRNDRNSHTPSLNKNLRYKDIKSKLNTGRMCVNRYRQSIVSSKITAKNEQAEDDVYQRDVFKQDGTGKGRDNTKEKRRKVIKSKIDTGRNNAVRHKVEKDIKSTVIPHVSVSNKQAISKKKPLLPHIKSVTQKKAVPITQHCSERRNSNTILAPLPKIRGQDVQELIKPTGVRNGSLPPLLLNHARNTPLPSIQPARRDNDNMKNGTKEDSRNDGVMWFSFTPSPTPRAQLSPPDIPDSAERTQQRA